MTHPNNGGPAFPQHSVTLAPDEVTLRDYALLTALPFCQKTCWDDEATVQRNAEIAVIWAAAYADAMIAARSLEGENKLALAIAELVRLGFDFESIVGRKLKGQTE
jgi:hypothetical protein